MGGVHWRAITLVVIGAVLLGGVSPAVAQSSPPDVGFVGDSLGVESEDEIRQELGHHRRFSLLAITNGAYVAWVRRHWLTPILRHPPSILVVGLGHGDANKWIARPDFDREVRAFLAEVTPHVDCIRWFDIREVPTYYLSVNQRAADFNDILHRAVAPYPEVEIVPYSAWVELEPRHLWERDKMHLRPAGEREYARMIGQAADSCDPALTTGPFWDVPDHYWAAPAIRWLHDAGIATGFADGTFRARLASFEVPVTHDQLAVMLSRREGSPVDWDPVGHGPFVRRGELIDVLWDLAGSPEMAEPAPWSDLPPWLEAPLAWAAAEGLAHGYADGTFRPALPATRAQVAQLLAPDDLPPPAPAPPRSGPYPPPLVLTGEPHHGPWGHPPG